MTASSKSMIPRAPKTAQINRTTSAVLAATMDLLAEIGYRRLTVERISERSGVARSTIYRHWDNVPALALDAFDTRLGPDVKIPDLGNVRDDLITFYGYIVKSFERSVWGRALPALIEASHNDETFKGLLSELVTARRKVALTIITRAQERGEIDKTMSPEWILDAISGPLYHRFLITGKAVDEPGFVSWLIDGALRDVKR